jgi:hypothetical protein
MPGASSGPLIGDGAELGTRDSGLGTRDSGLGIPDSGLGIRDSGLGIPDSGFGTRDSGLGTQVRSPQRWMRASAQEVGDIVRDAAVIPRTA